MLRITIPSIELYDEEKNEFITSKEQTLQLEHSLVSLSKWESKWCKPFLTKDLKTKDETIDYIKCMTITQNISDDVYRFVSQEIIDQVNDYIKAPMTAVKINRENRPANRETITAEIIYHWMFSFNIPLECQKWHLNRLLTLIEVCNIKSQPAKKINRRDAMSRNRSLNASRRKALNTKG